MASCFDRTCQKSRHRVEPNNHTSIKEGLAHGQPLDFLMNINYEFVFNIPY